MIGLGGGECQTRTNVVGFKKWVVLKDFLCCGAGCEQSQDITYAHPLAANARSSSAPPRLHSNSRQQTFLIFHRASFLNPFFC